MAWRRAWVASERGGTDLLLESECERGRERERECECECECDCECECECDGDCGLGLGFRVREPPRHPVAPEEILVVQDSLRECV